MVRDLEIKENDESQMISKKEKANSSNNSGHHCECCVCCLWCILARSVKKLKFKCFARYFVSGCSEHSDMLENQQNHPKMCHRGEIQCTCYYCTIFGHTVSWTLIWLKSKFFRVFFFIHFVYERWLFCW